MARADLHVEVVYSPRAGEVDRVELLLAAGSTVLQALQASRLPERHPEVDLARQRVGVWGHLRLLQDVLREGDRVELYRPLQVDPKQARRLRARRQQPRRPPR